MSEQCSHARPRVLRCLLGLGALGVLLAAAVVVAGCGDNTAMPINWDKVAVDSAEYRAYVDAVDTARSELDFDAAEGIAGEDALIDALAVDAIDMKDGHILVIDLDDVDVSDLVVLRRDSVEAMSDALQRIPSTPDTSEEGVVQPY